jgi:hypothetical protein
MLASWKGLGSKRSKTKHRSKPGSNRAASKEAKASNRASKEMQSRIGQTTEHRASSISASNSMDASRRTTKRPSEQQNNQHHQRVQHPAAKN